jgi:hypothetical protein
MRCVAGHQPNLYPYGGFFSKALYADCFVIVDNTQYVKKEYHNRNRIRVVNGEAAWLSLPVVNSGRYQQMINEVEIDNSVDWQKKHQNTLERNYRKAPFFEEIYAEIEPVFSREWVKLADFNINFISLAFKLLGIDTPIKIASDLGATGKASGLILDICQKTGFDAYLHGKHAVDYVDFDLLTSNGIGNYLQSFDAQPYQQRGNDFIPNLSILDLLFNCGSVQTLELLKKSTQITQYNH